MVRNSIELLTSRQPIIYVLILQYSFVLKREPFSMS